MAAIGNQSLQTPWLFTADTIALREAICLEWELPPRSFQRLQGESASGLILVLGPPALLGSWPFHRELPGQSTGQVCVLMVGAPAWSRQEKRPWWSGLPSWGGGECELHQALHTAVTLLRYILHLGLAGVQFRDILVTLSNCTTATIYPF